MRKVVIGSNNPVKAEAVKEAFAQVFKDETFEYLNCSAKSDVADQPFGVDETRLGAKNRSADCRNHYPEADFFVGLEGGIEMIGEEMWVSAWMCVQDQKGHCGFGRTSSFLLPPAITALVKEGLELGHATDKVFNDTNSGYKSGIVSFLTNGVINRKDFYREAMIFALIVHIHPDLY